MSLGVVVKGAEGIVLAVDSRVTLQAQGPGLPGLISLNFDNATKLLTLSPPHDHVGAVTYGVAVIGQRTAHSFLPEIEDQLKGKKGQQKVIDYAVMLSKFFERQWKDELPSDYQGPGMTFLVGGYDPTGPYGRVYQFVVPDQLAPVEQNPGDENFGMTWGGQIQIGSRIIHGYDPILPEALKQELGLDEEQVSAFIATLRRQVEFKIPYRVLPLQDCVNLATFMVRATMEAQDLGIGVRGVGGEIELAVVTRTESIRYLQRKKLKVQTPNG